MHNKPGRPIKYNAASIWIALFRLGSLPASSRLIEEGHKKYDPK